MKTRTWIKGIFVSLLATLAATGAWAADSLEETGGFVTETSTLAFKGMTLDEITATTLHGRVGGGWMSGKVGNPYGFYVFDRSVSGQMKCEAQINDSGTIKGVRLVFTQSGDDVYVATDGTGAAAMRYKSGATLGESLFVSGTTPSGSDSDTAYRVYNLSLTRSWSDSAVVIWEAGQFGVTSKTGSDGNTYTLNANGNSVAADGSSITINQSVGVKVDASAALTSGMTVLVRYSDLNLSLGSAQTLVNSSIDSNGTATGDGNGNRTGVYIDSSGASQGLWAGSNCTSANGVSQTSHTFVATETSGVMAFSYYSASTTDSSLGTHLWYLSNGTRSALYNLKTLGSTTDSSIYGCVIGGPRGSTTNGGPATGMKITGIAIFKGVLTESQMTSFVWPSASEKYSKFSYIPAARRLTWTTASTVTGDNLPNASTQYAVFDINSGDETGTKYTSGTDGNGRWQYLCQGQTSYYVAPGSLLRFKAGDYVKSLAGSFSPLTLGGIIVEEGATGYNFADESRYSSLGDPTNTAETYFDFYEDFTLGRKSGCHLDGTINITVASGKTFTISGSATTYAKTAMLGNNIVGTAGGTLKLHGGGHLAATLTASGSTLDYTDLPTTVSSSSDAFIQGTLTVNSGTVIALPAGATFPYYIAAGISGSLNVATGVTIGGAAAPYYQANAAGYIEYVAPSEVTISSDATWGSGDLTGWATDDATKDYIINVTADATLTLPSAVSCKTIVFNVSDGVTLTLDGTYAITAADEIEINGANGAVVSPSTSALSGTLQGNGVYWLKNATLTGFSAATIADADLTLRLTGCTGYFNGNTTSPGTLDLQDDGDTKAFTISNCSSSTVGAIVFAKLTGAGTFTASNADVFPRYAFTDPSGFTGTFAIPASVAGKTLGDSGFRPVRIILGAHGTLDPEKGTITIVSGTTASIAAGKTWTAPGGIEVDGTLNLGAGATAPKLKSGSDGMVVVASGGTATVSGIDSSAISPTLGIMGTLAFSDTTTTELTLTAEKLSNNGTLDLSGCTAVTTMNLVFGSTRSDYMFGTITPPPNLATVNVTVTEVLSEDGTALLTIPASLTGASTLNVTVTGLDGTTKTVTKSVSGSVLSVSYTPTVSGAACWIAYEMDYASGNANKTGFENSGSESPATALSSDTISGTSTRLESADAFTEDGMLYTYAHPWRNMTGDNAYPSSWTAVVRCTVPAYENAAVITFGTKDGGLIGLVAGADPETQMKLVKTTGNSAFTTLATMTVQNATTAQHVYVFSVENNQTIKVYCDGEQVLNETYSTFTLGGGIQVGSVHGGIGSTGIVRFGKDESPANTLSETVQKAARIDCVRLYKTVLGPKAIAQLSVEFPAVKLYRATVAANATTTWDALTWSPTWDGGNEYSKIILTTEGDATLTLPDSITADEFTINVASDSTLTLAKATGGTAMTVSKLEIDDGTVAVADANFFDSRAINGTGTLKITGNGELTSALSGNAKVEIPSNVAVGVTTGSIANPITGAGTLAYQNALPATSPSFGDWTGTVQLPTIATDVAINFNNYGIAGSTVAITSMTAGWIANAEVLPEINLVGNMTLNYFSGNWANTFDKLSGVGTFTLAADGTTDGYVNNYFLIKDVSDFTGSISVAAPGLAIGASKPASPTTYGQIYLTTSATIASGKTWTASNGIVLGTTDVTLTNTDGKLETEPTSGVENYKVVSAVGEGGTEYSLAVDTVSVTVPEVANASVSVNYTDVNGAAQTYSGAAATVLTVWRGSNVSATWTAANGYVITANGSFNGAVSEDVELTEPTVEARTAAVSDVQFAYGADYATATVTATVAEANGDGNTYTLAYGGNTYTGVKSGNTVTFNGVTPGSRYSTQGWSISAATQSGANVAVSGSTGGKVVVGDATSWIDERVGNTDVTGKWATAVTYGEDGFAPVGNNTFTASANASDVVTIEMVAQFDDVNTSADIDGNTPKGAIRLGLDGNSSPVFQVLTRVGDEAGWLNVTAGSITPNEDAVYTIAFTFDNSAKTYTATIDGVQLVAAGDVSSFAFANTSAESGANESISGVKFAGFGRVKYIKGDGYEGYMAQGESAKYGTIDSALASNDETITLLHDTASAISLKRGQTFNANGKAHGTVSAPNTVEYSITESGTYTVADKATAYTWVGDANGAGEWSVAGNWTYMSAGETSEAVTATRAPGAGDTANFTDEASVTVAGEVAVDTITATAAVSFTGTEASITASNAITLDDAAASITVNGVTLSPVPTTTMENRYVKSETDAQTGATTYSVDTYKVITITPLEHGAIARTDENGASVRAGTEIAFTVTPAATWKIASVTATTGGTAIDLGTGGTYTYTVTDDVTIAATMARDTVEVTVTPVGNTTMTVTATLNDENAIVASEGNVYTVLRGATVTVAYAAATSEYTIGGTATATGVASGAIVIQPDAGMTVSGEPTTYTWAGEANGEWSAAANWRYGNGNMATRAPGAGDTVNFTSAASVAVAGEVTVGTVAATGAVTFTGTVASITATAITLDDADASITVNGVTLSTEPTTTVAGSYVLCENSTYSVDAYKSVTFTTDAHSSATCQKKSELKKGDTVSFTVAADQNYTATASVTSGEVTLVQDGNTYTFTMGANDVEIAVAATHDTVQVTVPQVANASVSVNYTDVNGAAQTYSGAAATVLTVWKGTDVSATWTAASTYKITAGATQNINAIAVDTALVAPTVELDTVTFALPVVTGAKVTAVSGGTWNQDAGTITATIGETVTITWAADGAYVTTGTGTQSFTATAGMSAAPAPVAEEVTATAAVAKVGDTYYATIGEAATYANAQNPAGTVYLLSQETNYNVDGALELASAKFNIEKRLMVAAAEDSTASFRFAGGELSLSGTSEVGYGRNSNGTFTQTGGTISASELETGYGDGSTATVNFQGGSFTASKALLIGHDGDATIAIKVGGGQSTAVARFNDGNGVRFGRNGKQNTSEILTIAANGTLEVRKIQDGDRKSAATGVSKVVFDGGVLKALVNEESFLTSSWGLQYNIARGGMKVETDGHNVSMTADIGKESVAEGESDFTPAFTKTGAGAFTFSGASVPQGLTVTVAGGTVVIPAALENNIVLGDGTGIQSRDADAGTITLAAIATFDLTVSAIENTVATVTANGNMVEPANGVYTVPNGAEVVVAWTAATGYVAGGTVGGQVATVTLVNVRENATVTANEPAAVTAAPWKVSGSYHATLAAAYAAANAGQSPAMIEQNVETTAEAITVDANNTFWLKTVSGQAFNGAITLSGGTFQIDGNFGGTLGGTLTAAENTTSTIDCRKTTFTGLPALGGSGVVVVPHSGNTGLRIGEDKLAGFTGTIKFQPKAATTTLLGFNHRDGSTASVNVEVTPDWSVESIVRALDIEITGTINFKTFNVADQKVGVYVKNADTSIALHDGDSALANAFGLQNLKTDNTGYLKIVKSGTGALTLKNGFRMGNVTVLGMAAGYENNAASQTFQVVVESGTFTVENGAVLDNVAVTLHDGVTVSSGFTAKTISANVGQLLGAGENKHWVLTGTAGEGQTLAAANDTVQVTIPQVANASAAVTYTNDSGQQVYNHAANAAQTVLTVWKGTDVSATWTAVATYKITAGATQNITAIAADTALVAPTVARISLTVGNIAVTYGADYDTATVTATVSEDGEYTLAWDGGTPVAATAQNGTVSFTIQNPGVGYAKKDFTIAAGAAEVTGGAASSIVGDATAWIDERADTTGTANAGGTWESAVQYDNGTGLAEVVDNTFTAASANASDVVTVECVASFREFNNSDDVADDEPKVAIRINKNGEEEYIFQVYTQEDGAAKWLDVTNVSPGENATKLYDIVITMDNVDKKYAIVLDGTQLAAGGKTEFDFATVANGAEQVQEVVFTGKGSVKSIAGIGYESNMASFGGVKYATVAEALAAAEASANPGAISILHETAATPGTDWTLAQDGKSWTWNNVVTIADGGSVAVPNSFLAKLPAGTTLAGMRELLKSDSTTLADNGYNYYTCYALGLLDGDTETKPVVSVSSVTSEGNFVLALGGCGTIPENVTVTIKAQRLVGGEWVDVGESGAGTGTITLTPAQITGEGATGQLRFDIVIGAKTE